MVLRSVGDKKAAGTKVMFCSCTHKFQDSQYGKNLRVHNLGPKGYRCTVCGRTK